MKSDINPILIDLSKKLPDATRTLRYIQEPKSYEEIAVQARKEIFYLGNLEGFMKDGQSVRSLLQQSGYGRWLIDFENEDLLRLMGTLELIVELSEELADN